MKRLFEKLNLNRKAKIFLVIFLLFGLMGACSRMGWIGYYEMKKPAEYFYKKSKFNSNIYLYPNIFKITNDIKISLPKDCSGFKISGILTPFTPPIPSFWLRSWNWFNNDCSGYFSIYTNSNLKISLQYKSKIYNSNMIVVDDKAEYIFPIKTKNIDSGIIIIEQDKEIIEIPFKYKYIKFWY